MALRVPRLPLSLDPLIAEAKRRARRRRLWLALGLVAVGAVAVTLALRSGTGPGAPATVGGAASGGATANNGPVLAGGVAPVTHGRVVATVMGDATKVGERVRVTQVAAAAIDASGNFVLRPDTTSRPLALAILKAIKTNNSWVNLELTETGADRKVAITSIGRQYVDVSGKPFSPAEFRAAPGSGHWIGDTTGSTTVDPKYEVTLPSRQSSQP